MPTQLQLEAEVYWRRELVTTEVQWLAGELCRRTGRPPDAAGSKGDEFHLNGAHRSQDWILNSRWCTNRTYTVQSGLTAEQLRHVGGFDFAPGEWGTSAGRALMRVQTHRLLIAMQAGRLDEVRQLFGTLDGHTVIGWDNVANRSITSDPSHLDHWHLTFDRRHLRNRSLMERIVVIALETEDDMATPAEVWAARFTGDRPDGSHYDYSAQEFVVGGNLATWTTLDKVTALTGVVQQLADRPPVQSAPVDPATLKAVLLDAEVLAAIGTAVLDEQHRRDEA